MNQLQLQRQLSKHGRHQENDPLANRNMPYHERRQS